MLGDIRQAKKVYIVCGYTDMRKGLNSLVPFIRDYPIICVNLLRGVE